LCEARELLAVIALQVGASCRCDAEAYVAVLWTIFGKPLDKPLTNNLNVRGSETETWTSVVNLAVAKQFVVLR